MNRYIIVYPDELSHYGVKGMRWGHRKQRPVSSMGGRFHRLAAANYNLNARMWNRLGNKTAAGMQRRAANDSLKKAAAADSKRYEKRRAVINKAADVAGAKSKAYYKDVDRYKTAKLTGSATESDRKRWVKASKNAGEYYLTRHKDFSNMANTHISRKDVKKAKKWLKAHDYGIHDAEYTDYGNNKNYLNELDSMDKRRKINY